MTASPVSFNRQTGRLDFVKMHGAGNDFIVFDARQSLPFSLSELAQAACDRHFGVGADGLIALENSNSADFKMLYFNADGGSTICGNGMRCIARFIAINDLLKPGQSELSLETETGRVQIQILDNGDRARVNMGAPIFEGLNIPVAEPGEHLAVSLTTEHGEYTVSAVGMGNPHCVIFTDGIDKLALDKIGPPLENHRFFPKRTNVEFVEVLDYSSAKMRVWERGVGETLACGTGICAVIAAGVRAGVLNRAIQLQAAGGMFEVEWSEADNSIYLTGPAADVFRGSLDVERLLAQRRQ